MAQKSKGVAGHKDLSAAFLSSAKWDGALKTLEGPLCDWTQIRLYHNVGSQTEQLLKALKANQSVRKLFIGVVDLVGAAALEVFLGESQFVQSLEIQHIENEAAAKVLAQGLAGNSSVQDLLLPGVEDPAYVAHIAAGLALRTAPLKSLHMSRGCKVTEACCSAAGHGMLLSLCVPDCRMGNVELLPILQLPLPSDPAKLALHNLTELDLSRNKAGADSIAALGQLLGTGGRLQKLTLSQNHGCCSGSGSTLLARLLPQSHTLTHLDLASCGIGASDCVALAAGLRNQSSLAVLNLEGNSIGGEGLLAILTAMQTPWSCQLSQLRLQRNGICFRELPSDGLGPSGGAITAPLRMLDLSLNPISDLGVIVLVNILSKANQIESLQLTDCCISDKGVESLAGFIMSKPKLRTLTLDLNRIKSKGGQMLLDTISAHPGLTSFSAEDNRITDSHLKKSLSTLSLDIGGRLYEATMDASNSATGDATA